MNKRLDLASLRYQEVLDSDMDRRAIEGVDSLLHYKGEIFGHERQYSDDLLMFRRKQRDPSFCDNFVVNVNHQDPRVTSLVYNFPPGLEVPARFQSQPPTPEPVTDAEYRE